MALVRAHTDGVKHRQYESNGTLNGMFCRYIVGHGRDRLPTNVTSKPTVLLDCLQRWLCRRRRPGPVVESTNYQSTRDLVINGPSETVHIISRILLMERPGRAYPKNRPIMLERSPPESQLYELDDGPTPRRAVTRSRKRGKKKASALASSESTKVEVCGLALSELTVKAWNVIRYLKLERRDKSRRISARIAQSKCPRTKRYKNTDQCRAP